jgi:hypothetical protein
MPSLWRELFTISRPSSRNRSRSRSGSRGAAQEPLDEPFNLVKPYARTDDYSRSSRKRSHSHPPKPQPIHIRAPSQPEMIHVLPPAAHASDPVPSRKSFDAKLPRNVSLGGSSMSASASSFNAHNGGIRQPSRHDYHQHSTRSHRQRAMSVAPRPDCVRLHELLMISRRHHTSALTYDVLLTPSMHSVFDNGTGQPVSRSVLAEPATYPSLSSSLTLHSELLPWPVKVFPVQSKSQPRFYIPSSRSEAGGSHHPITILDILWAIHNSLNVPATQQEWDSLGSGSKTQKRISRAYEDRCRRLNGGWEAGVKRGDWLGSRTILAGIEVLHDGSTNEYHLSFTRPH